MCDSCGCGLPGNEPAILKPGEEKVHNQDDHDHSHDHGLAHDHNHGHSHIHEDPTHHHHNHDAGNTSGRRVEIEEDVLARNNLLAERNRGYFEAKGILGLNLVSSPGSGKTSLLERTIKEMGKEHSFFVIEGDQQTMNDANRIQEAGAPVVQVNTGQGCHLDADMVNRAIKKLEPADESVLMIENVGNLVCPAMFDLGESSRVVIMSVTEGEDKPAKYPYMFQTSNLCIINKTDLLPYVDFDVEKARAYALKINPQLEFIELSVKTGDGMDKWYEWLADRK
ncbi:MAG: hydrogenase nickel incorporation protein HypB [Planctomycetota bacterium]